MDVYREFKKDETINEIDVPSLFSIYIDSVQLKDVEWVLTNHKNTGQKGFFLLMNNLNISQGIHKIIIDKISWDPNKGEFYEISPWEEILFYKE